MAYFRIRQCPEVKPAVIRKEDDMKIEELYARLLLKEAVTKEKAIALAGQIIAQITIIDSKDSVEAPRGVIREPITEIVKEVVKPASRPISKPSGKVVAPKGNLCVCSMCKEFIYQNVADVYEQGMSTEDFLASYNPIKDARPLTESDIEDVLAGDNGAMYINCPSCKGVHSLEIIPAKVVKKESMSVGQGNAGLGIVSINPGQFGV